MLSSLKVLSLFSGVIPAVGPSNLVRIIVSQTLRYIGVSIFDAQLF